MGDAAPPPLHGWLGPSAEVGSRCTIDVREAGQFSVAEFVRSYAHKRAVLVRGGASSWPAQRLWSKAHLRAILASTEITARGSRGQKQFVTFGAFLDETAAGASCSATAGGAEGGAEGGADGAPYLFEMIRGRPLSSNASRATARAAFDSLLAEAPWPDYVAHWPEPRRELFLAVGGDRSGLAFHSHREAWCGVVVGCKRWFLYHADSAFSRRLQGDQAPSEHSDGDMDLARFEKHAWVSSVLPRLPRAERPHVCTQRRGDWLYVPGEWAHMVVNEGEVVAVTSVNMQGIEEEVYG